MEDTKKLQGNERVTRFVHTLFCFGLVPMMVVLFVQRFRALFSTVLLFLDFFYVQVLYLMQVYAVPYQTIFSVALGDLLRYLLPVGQPLFRRLLLDAFLFVLP